MSHFDTNLGAAIVGLVGGAIGYWLSNFWFNPILQYRNIRMQVNADFIFYAQVVNADGLNDKMMALLESRIEANRRNAADLTACIEELPRLYLWQIRRKGQNPDEAAKNLIGFSNTHEYEEASRRVRVIRRSLGLRQLDE
jgi:hypothetical protein